MNSFRATRGRLALCVALACACGAAAQGTSNDDILAISWEQADTVAQQYDVARALADSSSQGSARLAATALEQVLASRPEIRKGQDTALYESLSRALIGVIERWNYREAAHLLWTVVEDSADPLSRADALMALGSLAAAEYTTRIAAILSALNGGPTTDPRGAEQVAFGAVVALERLRAPEGFPAVFYASAGWYGARVRTRAEGALSAILPDPTEAILSILDADNPSSMRKALAHGLGSKAADDGKRRVALKTLERGTTLGPGTTKADRKELSALRMEAMAALKRLPASGDGRANLAAESYRIGTHDEKLEALSLLGKDPSAEAAQALSDIILRLDEDQRAGVGNADRTTLAKAAMEAAAENRQRSLVTAVLAVRNNQGWSDSVIALAKAALEALQ
ncbi:MAG: hypothetical protein JW923_08765 [Spirochaetales bacterium]|nr:hypothetical protein [Spirochaetales bacterium]